VKLANAPLSWVGTLSATLAAMSLCLAAIGAIGAGAEALQPSALRLAVTSVLAVLSLLFWPGVAPTPGATVWRVAGWSVAVALLAMSTLAALRTAGLSMQPWPLIFASCGMLLLILIVAHTLAALLEWCLRARGADGPVARESAGRTVAVVLVLLGALPLWLGPLAELAAPRLEWLVDGAIAASPLTHLAVASGNDLLRNQWLYQHANLAALQFSYPGLAALLWSYAAAGLALALLIRAAPRLRRPPAGPPNSLTVKEISP
jgi:hypothetical protein